MPAERGVWGRVERLIERSGPEWTFLRAGAKYVLTGPAAVTQAEQVRVIGEAAGVPARWQETTPEEARPRLLAALGDPGFVAGVNAPRVGAGPRR